MERSIFGFLQLLCVICILTGAQAFQEAPWTVRLYLAFRMRFTNLVNSVHAFYMTHFR